MTPAESLTAIRTVRRPWWRRLERNQVNGIILLVLGAGIFLLLVPGTESGQVATFGLNVISRAKLPDIPDLEMPVQATLVFGGLISLILGGWQLARGSRQTGLVLGLGIFIFVFAFLTWAARGQSFNLTGMIASSLLRATPITLAALSGVWCERSGVINIGIEGMMLTSAFTGVVAASATNNLYFGLVVAGMTGAMLGGVLAVLAVRFQVDQIIAGTAINIFATGLTSFLSASLLAVNQNLNAAGNFRPIILPVISRIPVLAPILFNVNFVIYLMMFIVIATHVLLFFTRWGLRSRAVGEHPRAADTLGINVYKMRYINVMVGGLIAGLGGSYFTLGSVGRFDEGLTAGKGFIGLAAMIFGKWTPIGAFGASLVFGFADSLQIKLAILQTPIPSQFLLMAPYLLTIIAIAGVVGRASPPAADGQPYVKQ